MIPLRPSLCFGPPAPKPTNPSSCFGAPAPKQTKSLLGVFAAALLVASGCIHTEKYPAYSEPAMVPAAGRQPTSRPFASAARAEPAAKNPAAPPVDPAAIQALE